MNTPEPLDPRNLAHRLTAVGGALHHRLLTQLRDDDLHPKTVLLLSVIDGRIDAPWVTDRLARGGKRINALADRGWITRTDDAWTLTDEGRAVLDRVDAERQELLADVPAPSALVSDSAPAAPGSARAAAKIPARTSRVATAAALPATPTTASAPATAATSTDSAVTGSTELAAVTPASAAKPVAVVGPARGTAVARASTATATARASAATGRRSARTNVDSRPASVAAARQRHPRDHSRRTPPGRGWRPFRWGRYRARPLNASL